MFEALFGVELPLPVRFFIAFVIVLGLISVAAWVFRRLGAKRRVATAAHGHQPRLAVIDAAPVDARRTLILIRRDNVEHLLMIGGPTDVVVEANIVRASTAQRDAPAPKRAATTTDTLPRVAPLGGKDMWPLQPEPKPAIPPRPEHTSDLEVEPELAVPQSRERRPVNSLAGLAAELPPSPAAADRSGGTHAAASAKPVHRPRKPVRQSAVTRPHIREQEPRFEPEPFREPDAVRPRTTARESFGDQQLQSEPEAEPAREPEVVQKRRPAPPSITDLECQADADQNLAELAQQLDASLRRPEHANELWQAESTARSPTVESANLQPALAPGGATPAEANGTWAARPKPTISFYDSLEKELATVLDP
jgi:flagellar protein FliO/FliZ